MRQRNSAVFSEIYLVFSEVFSFGRSRDYKGYYDALFEVHDNRESTGFELVQSGKTLKTIH